MTRKVQVSFSENQLDLIQRLKGTFGNTNAEVVRNIVLAWLSEKSFISNSETNANRKIRTYEKRSKSQ